MKLNSLLILGALAVSSAAQAATFDVYITGSTAGRSSTFAAVAAALTGETVYQDDASLPKAVKANFIGGTNGGNTYNVYCAFYGSAAGIQALDTPLAPLFMTNNTGGAGVPGTITTATHAAHIALADVFQNTTIFTTSTLTDTKAIVLPFKFMTSPGSPVTNVKPQVFQVIASGGEAPAALFTGSSADRTKGVILCGRDSGSGTRLVTMAETGNGANYGAIQWEPTFGPSGAINQTLSSVVVTNGSAAVTHAVVTTFAVAGQPVYGAGIPVDAVVAAAPAPTATTFSLSVPATANGTAARLGLRTNVINSAPGGGADSGGKVANYVSARTDFPGFVLSSDNGLSPSYMLGYLGLADATTAATQGAVECSYNGVTYSDAALQDGSYTLWGYLHLFIPTTPAAGAQFMHDQILANLIATPGSSGRSNILTSALPPGPMAVRRLADGSNVITNY
ncbi:hypothetical protein BH11VER1_BH11VER1_29850 [soil metagenome]